MHKLIKRLFTTLLICLTSINSLQKSGNIHYPAQKRCCLKKRLYCILSPHLNEGFPIIATLRNFNLLDLIIEMSTDYWAKNVSIKIKRL